VTYSIKDTEHNNALYYAECRILYYIMLNVVMLNVVMCSVVALLHDTGLERLAMGQHSSLLGPIVSSEKNEM
jgi:hypothetical protein